MTPIRRVALVAFASSILAGLWPSVASAEVERRFERTFRVGRGALVAVDVAGASITTAAGPRDTVTFVVRQTVDTNSEADADRALALYTISADEAGGRVSLLVRRDNENRRSPQRPRVRFAVTVTVPDDVPLDLRTSGGSIVVRGSRPAALEADTSGGSIEIDGGTGSVDVNTSGGSIRISRALGDLRAETSGGSITVTYLGPDVRSVDLDTSGGNIRVGLDAKARLHLTASTSGGRVAVEGLPFVSDRPANRRQTRLSGTINGGGGSLRAATSGGNVVLAAAN